MFRHKNRQEEIRELTAKGILPRDHDVAQHPEKSLEARGWLLGQVAALIDDVLPAREIVENMVRDAAAILRRNSARVTAARPKL